MSDLKHTLTNIAERGTPVGSERLRERVMLDLGSGSSSTSWIRRGTRRPPVAILAVAAATLLLVGALPLLLGPLGGDELVTAPLSPVVGVGDGQTVSVTVSGVSGRAGDELAGVLYEGSVLTDLDADALGGFWTVVEGDDFTATEVVREPGTVGVGRFPFVSDEALTVEPGMYTLVLWVDEGLGPVSRWVPINTYTDGDVLIEGTDLFGCHTVFEVGDDAPTDVAVEAGLHHNGWNVDCATGVAIPGTDAAAAVAPDDISRPPINALPSTLPSQLLPAREDPFEWRWEAFSIETSEGAGMRELVNGEGCYGGGGDQRPAADVAFNDTSIGFTLGHPTTPDVVVTDRSGAVAEIGNPFGEGAWLCSVAANNTRILAVGSGVWWSEDGVAWHGIEAFEQFAGSNIDGSDLMWAAAGPGGYMVLGREGVVWFSEDLETWHEIHLEFDGYGASVWGWVGPTGISVEEEIVITMFNEGWIGTRRDG